MLSMALFACTTPATGVVIQLDTNIPTTRTMQIVATTYLGSTRAGLGRSVAWSRGAGVDGGVSLPASFGVTPGADHPSNAAAIVDVRVTLAATAGQQAIAFTRSVQFRFIPHLTTTVPIFLAAECAAPATGCAAMPCTVGERCREQGLTCDRGGVCVNPQVTLIDAGTADAGAMDARMIDAVATDATPDVPVTDACRPDCTGRACGSNGCGGTCGACADGRVCNGAHQCACTAPQTDCGGTCADLDSSAANCGACGAACSGAQVCSGGVCSTSCAGSLTQCGAGCVDLQSDRSDCGSCARVCPASQSCSSGACVCAAGETLCGAACVDVQADPSNCGSCGRACSAGQSCALGMCVPAPLSLIHI